MTRLDRFVIFCVIAGLVALIFGAQPSFVYDPAQGRRPLPEVPTPAPTPATPSPPVIVEPTPERVRRPLPLAAPSPSDPLYTAEVDTIEPGMMMVGTSFPIGRGLWMTARHVANADCQRLYIVIGGEARRAQIKFLHPDADLAVLQTPFTAPSWLPINDSDAVPQERGYGFGFPAGNLGGMEDQLLGRSRFRLEGRLQGTAAVLTWAEVRRYPDSLAALSGISGGPMFDPDGKVIGINVASSERRGRVHTVAPEILRQTQSDLALGDAGAPVPAREVTAPGIALDTTAQALSNDSRIAKTYCLPTKS